MRDRAFGAGECDETDQDTYRGGNCEQDHQGYLEEGEFASAFASIFGFGFGSCLGEGGYPDTEGEAFEELMKYYGCYERCYQDEVRMYTEREGQRHTKFGSGRDNKG